MIERRVVKFCIVNLDQAFAHRGVHRLVVIWEETCACPICKLSKVQVAGADALKRSGRLDEAGRATISIARAALETVIATVVLEIVGGVN